MMLGRNESMPNVAAEADMSPGDRDIARAIALDILEREVHLEKVPKRLLAILARAVVRYVPGGVPDAPAPTAISSSDDQTRRASIADLPAGVICEPVEEESSGVVEPSDDGEGTRRVGDLGLTRAINLDDTTRR